MFVLLWSAFAASPTGINNPGGDRIPYVKLQSEHWDIVIRMTGDGVARVERMKARCKANLWVNGCAPGIDPELRQIAMNGAFQDRLELTGNFTYCSTALVKGIPTDLARGVVRAEPDRFCKAFLNAESVRGQRSGNATQGENDLVNRLMGGKNTTSGTIRMKAPPTRQGTSAGREREATGERRTARQTANNRRIAAPEPEAPVETKGPRVPAAATSSGVDELDGLEPSAQVVSDEGTGLRDASEPAQVAAVSPTLTEQGGGSSAVEGEVGAPAITRQPDLLANEEEPSMDFIPPPEPEPEPMDPELAALLAPLPGLPEEDQVVVPAPKPVPTRQTEFERLEQENAALAQIARDADEADDKNGKDKKKGKDKSKEETVEVGSDQQFGDYIIIDIESLPDE
jgi:hypothetical protein